MYSSVLVDEHRQFVQRLGCDPDSPAKDLTVCLRAIDASKFVGEDLYMFEECNLFAGGTRFDSS